MSSPVEDTIHKLVPPILLACIFALTQAYILTGQNEDTIKRLEETNKMQWQLIMSNKEKNARHDERFVSKDQFYKEISW